MANILPDNLSLHHELKNTTSLKKDIFSFTWSIEQFGEFMGRKYEFYSPAFFSKSSQETRWKLMAFPENIYPEGTHVALRLLKECDDDKCYSVMYSISIIDGNGKNLPVRTREKVFRHYQDFDDCLVMSNQIMKEKNLLSNGNLTINCKMDLMIAVNPEDKLPSSLKSPESIKIQTQNNLSETNSFIKPIESEKNILYDSNNTLFRISREKSMDDSENIKTRKNLELLSDDFKSLYMNKNQCDVTVRVEDGEIRAHRVILASRSEYFKQVCSTMVQSHGNLEIYISEVKSVVLDAILYYLYTGQLRQLTFQFAMDLLKACNQLNLHPLKDMIQNFLKSQININNVTEILRISKEMKMNALKNCALKFISANHTMVTKTEKWNQMMRNDPHTAGEVFLTIASFQKCSKTY